MTIYDDLKAAAGTGLQRTADDFYARARLKFYERLGQRKPKSELERNVTAAYIDTPTGRASIKEYQDAQIKKYLSDPLVWVIGALLLFLIVGTLRR